MVTMITEISARINRRKNTFHLMARKKGMIMLTEKRAIGIPAHRQGVDKGPGGMIWPWAIFSTLSIYR
jgi:hypothetical protein